MLVPAFSQMQAPANDQRRAKRVPLPPRGAMLFDPDAVGEGTPALLRPDGFGAVDAEAGRGGRGAVWYVDAPGGQAVLRHYRRGGAMARLSRDLYLFRGERQTRPFREFLLLQHLYAAGLPVPLPLAAGYQRRGAFYRADILTRRILAAESLAERLQRGPLPEALWRHTGATIARFHAAGACHADLNAHNVLLTGDDTCWLIDFDRGALLAPGAWRQANIARLERSLRKLAAARGQGFDDVGWAALCAAYMQGSAA